MPLLRKAGLMAFTFFALTFFGAATARADQFLLTSNNFGQVGSLGTITTTLQGDGSIKVTVQLTAGYVLHGNDALGFNVVGSFANVAITNITCTQSNPCTEYVAGNGGTFNGFGSRTFSLDGQTTSVARANNDNNLMFVVTTTTAGGFQSASALQAFAVQIALQASGAATGFASSTPETVPEPTTMLLLGTGLAGIAARARRRRKA